MDLQRLIALIDELFAKYGFTPMPQMKIKPGRRVVGVMHHPRNPGRVERDEEGKYFGVCSSCDFESKPLDTFDEAHKALTEHRGHCSVIHNKGAIRT